MTARMQTGALQANGETAPDRVMDVADVARTVRHMAELPLEANVRFATVLATAMPYVGRGRRQLAHSFEDSICTSGIDYSVAFGPVAGICSTRLLHQSFTLDALRFR